MAFDGMKNLFGVNIKDGVPGKAVVQSSSVPSREASSYNVSMWLDVYVEGWEPYRTELQTMVKAGKHPWPGKTLPVIVDRENKERIDVQWDEVQTVDERMREGQPSPIAPGQAGAVDLSALLGGGAANVTGHETGETIDMTGTELGNQTRQALQAQGLAPQSPGVEPEAGVPAGSGNMVEDRIAQLERLAKLHESGALSDAEFQAEKARILGQSG